MHVVACAAPTGLLEPAPITSLPLAAIVGNTALTAYWGSDDAYYVLASAAKDTTESADQWFRIEAGEVAAEGSLEERMAIARLMANITPIGGGRVAFPVGSSGRRIYRVWRTTASASGGRTRILEVRAARSRRRPA